MGILASSRFEGALPVSLPPLKPTHTTMDDSRCVSFRDADPGHEDIGPTM